MNEYIKHRLFMPCTDIFRDKAHVYIDVELAQTHFKKRRSIIAKQKIFNVLI